jgi:hypothetical protein
MNNKKKMKSLYIFLILIVITGIALGVYFGIKDNKSNKQYKTVEYGNFKVIYSGTNDFISSYSNYTEQAINNIKNFMNEEISLQIEISQFSENSNTLARAGPYSIYNLRGGGYLEINTNKTAASWTDVIEHEILHILGIGTNYKWRHAVFYSNGYNLSSNEFPETYQVYIDNYVSNGDLHIPLSNYDTGSHFSESIFGTELMTPFSNEGNRQPITLLTLTALKELGWNVNLEKAEEKN